MRKFLTLLLCGSVLSFTPSVAAMIVPKEPLFGPVFDELTEILNESFDSNPSTYEFLKLTTAYFAEEISELEQSDDPFAQEEAYFLERISLNFLRTYLTLMDSTDLLFLPPDAMHDEVPDEYQWAWLYTQIFLEYIPLSQAGLEELLLLAEEDAEAIAFVIEEMGIEWEAIALRVAREYLNHRILTTEEVSAQLSYEGFSNQEAEYALQQISDTNPVE